MQLSYRTRSFETCERQETEGPAELMERVLGVKRRHLSNELRSAKSQIG